jgi:hypothetical protein
MVAQKLYAMNCDSYWLQSAKGKCYPAYLGRGIKRSQLNVGCTVEVSFHNRKAYIEKVIQ